MITLEQQLNAAARHKKQSKLQLIGELLESDRIIRADARQIFELGERVKRIEAALNQIIELENAESVQSYGFGDIARLALNNEIAGLSLVSKK